jgi:hypothetical protein
MLRIRISADDEFHATCVRVMRTLGDVVRDSWFSTVSTDATLRAARRAFERHELRLVYVRHDTVPLYGYYTVEVDRTQQERDVRTAACAALRAARVQMRAEDALDPESPPWTPRDIVRRAAGMLRDVWSAVMDTRGPMADVPINPHVKAMGHACLTASHHLGGLALDLRDLRHWFYGVRTDAHAELWNELRTLMARARNEETDAYNVRIARIHELIDQPRGLPRTSCECPCGSGEPWCGCRRAYAECA